MKKSYLSRKEEIVIQAIKTIDELGIYGFTTRELAKRVGIKDCTLYSHFKSKNEILLAVLDHFSCFDLQIMISTEAMNLNSRESILYFLKSYVEYYGNYPAITSLWNNYEFVNLDDEVMSKFIEIMGNRSDFITKFIVVGQDRGEISKSIACEDLSDILMGFVRIAISKWRMNNYNFSLKDKILKIAEYQLNLWYMTE